MSYRTENFIRRRRFLINKNLQYSFLFSTILNSLLLLGVLGAALFVPLFVKLSDASRSSWEAQQAVAGIALYLHANFWPAALLALVLICLLSIRTSHRIAGPLYKITLALESLKSGNLPKMVRVRKGDDLVAEVDVTNQMLDRLREQVMEIQEAQAGLNAAIFAWDKTLDHASTAEFTEHINDIREKAAQLTNRISYFKVE